LLNKVPIFEYPHYKKINISDKNQLDKYNFQKILLSFRIKGLIKRNLHFFPLLIPKKIVIFPQNQFNNLIYKN
jgi:hypothetical protein